MPARPDIGDLDVARRLVGYTWELSLDQLADEGHPTSRVLLWMLALFDAPISRHHSAAANELADLAETTGGEAGRVPGRAIPRRDVD